jgi:hypothetical protein
MYPRTPMARLGAAALVTVALLGSVPYAANAAVPAFTLEERAQAIAQPAVIFTEFTAKGVVRKKSDRKPISAEAITVAIRCSAVVINGSGIAITTRYCVAPTHDHINDWAFNRLADREINSKRLTAAKKQQYIDGLKSTADFTAVDAQGEPPQALYAQIGDAVAGRLDAPAFSAEVMTPTDGDDGGFATIKLAKSDLPAVELNTGATLAAGTPLMAFGYSSSGGKEFETLPYASGASPIKITTVGTNTPKSYKFSGNLPIEWRGGPAVDLDGKLAGGLLWSDTINDAQALSTALQQGGATNQLSTADKEYRAALDDYYAGRYTSAIKRFTSVIAAQPTNTMATKYRAQAESHKAIENGDTPMSISPPLWLVIAISLLIGAIITFVVVFLLVRRRARRQPTLGTDSLLPVSVNPFEPPTSGSGAYPTSDGGYATYPTGGYTTLQRGEVPMPSPTVLEIPQAAPPGVPVPHPPVQRPPVASAPASPTAPISAPPTAPTSVPPAGSHQASPPPQPVDDPGRPGAPDPAAPHPGPAQPPAAPPTGQPPAAPAEGPPGLPVPPMATAPLSPPPPGPTQQPANFQFVWPEDSQAPSGDGPENGDSNPWAPPPAR